MIQAIVVVVLAVLIVGFLLSAVDDLAVDAVYWINRLVGRRTLPPITRAELDSVPQRRAAILIPAWQEHNVIFDMLRFNAGIIDYDEYDIFVGTYPNDHATVQELRRAQNELAHVFLATNAHEGPTNKADNLNSMIQRLAEREKETGERYAFVVLHDPEDVLHPLELKLCNYHLTHSPAAMVQTPILPLREPLGKVTASTYMDEFAEVHTKDLHVREWMSGFVPSAGVGTALQRDIIDVLAGDNGGHAFGVDSLTEDYELGLRIVQAGDSACFVRQRIADPPEGVPDLIATRAHFPDDLRRAVRQRTRWTLGIAFQSWKNLGWTGSLAVRWMLFRDRKAIFTNVLVAVGYLFVLYVVSHELLRYFRFPHWPPPIPDLWWIRTGLFITLLIMLHRLLQRGIATTRVYGVLQGIASVPRQVWSNLINAWATLRAARQFLAAEWTGVEIAWDKTKQRVPLLARSNGRRRLGEILRGWGHLTASQLEHCLESQRHTGRRIGAELIERGFISTTQLVRALRAQEGDEDLPYSTSS